jgi:hypothetical protein
VTDERRLDRIEYRLDLLERELSDVVREKKIAEAVAAELRRNSGLPWPAKLGAFLAGAVVVADALRGLIS